MHGKAKLLEQLFGKEFGNARDLDMRTPDSFVALERRLVWSIEYEQWVNVEGEETQEAVIECSQCRIRATFSRLNLEKPDADVDCESERT